MTKFSKPVDSTGVSTAGSSNTERNRNRCESQKDLHCGQYGYKPMGSRQALRRLGLPS